MLNNLIGLEDELRSCLFENILPFWLDYGIDSEHNGIHTCLDKKGRSFSEEKSVWMQGRGGWLFAYIANTFNPENRWISASQTCVEFLRRYCIDPDDGRMFFSVSTTGLPFRKRRYFFSELFYIMANAELFRCTGNEELLKEALKYHSLVVRMYRSQDYDPYKVPAKFLSGFPAKKNLITTAMLMHVTSVLRNADQSNANTYLELENELKNEIIGSFYSRMYCVLLENVDENGNYIKELSSGRIINIGHNFEVLWYLLDDSAGCQSQEYIDWAAKCYKKTLEIGWDKDFGGFYTNLDLEGWPVPAFEADMKLWWVHTEAINCAIRLFRITGDKSYYNDFKTFLSYAHNRFLDSQNGEWVAYLHRDGSKVHPETKGNLFKGPFHVPRMYSETIKELITIRKNWTNNK